MSDMPVTPISGKKTIERKVILLYKNNPFLWKKTHPRYSNAGLKKYALDKIALHLKITKQQLASIIQYVRNRIGQIVRNFVDADSKGGVVVIQSKYEYFTDCQFLFDEFLRRRRKRDQAKRARSAVLVRQSISERLLCESSEWIFAMVMDLHNSLGISEDNQINWDEISQYASVKASLKISPTIAKKIWINLSKNIFDSFKQIKEVLNETPTGCETIWEALEKLVHFSGMILLSVYVKSILNVYVKKCYSSKFEDNQFLFDLISKYPILMRTSKKDKKEEKLRIWDEITKSYNKDTAMMMNHRPERSNTPCIIAQLRKLCIMQQKKTNNALETVFLRKQWCQLLRKIENRMRIFKKSMRNDYNTVSICAPTDLEKKILKCFPRLLLASFCPNLANTSDGKSCAENERSYQLNAEDADDSILTEEIDNSESIDKTPSNEEKASPRLEIIDIDVGEEECANVSEIDEDFLDELEIKHITFGISNPEDQLSDDDASFLLMKWLVQNLKLKENVESALSSYDISSGIWENIAEKILPFSSLHSPESLYSKWRGIFVDTIYNLQSVKRSPTEMTSLDWMVLQSFPNLFVDKVEESEDQNSTIDFVHTSINDSSQSPSPVLQCNREIILQTPKSNHYPEIEPQSAVNDYDPSREISDTKWEQSTCDKNLPELKRHQKPIILSDKIEVLKMNQQLQTASVAPSRFTSAKMKDKIVIVKKCKKGRIKDLQLSSRKADERYRLSYRPNPKFSNDVPDWMKKTKVTIGDYVPVVPQPRKEDAAYQHFLKVLQSFSKFKTSPTKNIHKEMNDEIFTALALQGIAEVTQEAIDKFKDLLISDSGDNSDDILLNYSNEINVDVEENLPEKKPRKKRQSKKNLKKSEASKADADCNDEIVYLTKVSNSKNPRVVINSGILSNSDSDSDWSVNKKSAKRTRKLQYKKPAKRQMTLTQCQSENQPPTSDIMKVTITADIFDDPITVPVNVDNCNQIVDAGALLSNSSILETLNQDQVYNNLPLENVVLSLDSSHPLLGATLEDSTVPIPPPSSDVVSQVPEPCNLDLRSYYSMMADSLLDMSNLDDVEMDKSNEIPNNNFNGNPATDLINVSDKLTNVDNSADKLFISPKILIETITLSDSDDDIPLAQLIKPKKI